MRNTLVIGLLLCLPTVVLLASVSLAVLLGKVRRVPPRRFCGLPITEPGREELHDDASSLSSAAAGR
jgi:hypothetical protein